MMDPESNLPPLEIGRFNHLQVAKIVEFGIYLATERGNILMPGKYVPEGTQVDDWLDAFVYTDSEDRLIATTLRPYAQVGDFACLTVKQVAPFGAFLDWGLEKDLLVPVKEQHRTMEAGKTYVVKVCLDPRTERVIGVGKIAQFLYKGEPDLENGQEVNLFVYEMTDLGIMCIIDDTYSGILYKNEIFQNIGLGDKLKGYVKKVRQDFKIDLTLRKPGFKGIKDERHSILEKLEASGGFLPYHDNSSPEEIKEVFQMSKKSFKALIGTLYKEGRISIETEGIRLQKPQTAHKRKK
jgi:predicted RNA-binding protein (virulence factor B family)